MEAEGKSRRLRILMADDDSAVRTSFQEFLHLLGHETHAAADGREALELFQNLKGELDLLITDIYMPKIDGLDLIRYVRQEDSTIPIIATTGYMDDTRSQGLAELRIPIFTKPLNFFDFENHLLQFSAVP